MNQNGLVVGWAGNNPENDYHPCRAFSWTQGGGLKDLGTPGGPTSRALALNDNGYISGWADYTPEGITAGCLWTPMGEIFNLSTLVINLPGEKIGDGIAINAGGVIVGRGNGGGAAYMLVPQTANISPVILLLLE